jgi:hypothetical protein
MVNPDDPTDQLTVIEILQDQDKVDADYSQAGKTPLPPHTIKRIL